MHLATRIAEALGQARFDRGVAVFVFFVKDEGAALEVCGKPRQRGPRALQFAKQLDVIAARRL